MKLISAECTVKTPDDGQRRCPKHVEVYNRINLDNYCVLLVIEIEKRSMLLLNVIRVKSSWVFLRLLLCIFLYFSLTNCDPQVVQ